MAAAIVPPGSTLSRCRPWQGPPKPSKNHHGTPFIAVSTMVRGPSSGPMTAAADRAACALTASTTRSCWPSSAASAAARTGAVISSPPLSVRQPCACRAASVAPRASAEVSTPAAASLVPIRPPIAPAPSTHTRIGAPPVSTRPECRRKRKPLSFAAPRPYPPACARSSSAMSSLPMDSMAWLARVAFSGSGSLSSEASTVGTTCHERPKRSFSQPHGPG